MCTISATSGLLRTAAGDQAFHAGLYIRVAMLASALLVGLLIVRLHSNPVAVSEAVDSGGSGQSAVMEAGLQISDCELGK
jgi:hypothetical protein